MSDAFDERLARTQQGVDQVAAARERSRTEREQRVRQERANAVAAAHALLPELRASIEALRAFEEADPASSSRWRLERTNVNIGFFPDSAPVAFIREYRPARGIGRGSVIDRWVLRAGRGGLTITVPRSAKDPLLVEPWETLEQAADVGIYSSGGRVVVTSEAFEAVIQMIADHIARGH